MINVKRRKLMMKPECKTCKDNTCPIHKRYKAERKPKCSCKTCWEIWEKRNKDIKNSHESGFNSGDLMNAMCGRNRISQRGRL